ncbi:MAG: DUF3037 domain-containing protein [Terriglobales bacterium]
MAETLRTCEFTLIRVYPDPIRKEFLNVGVCLFEPAGGFAAVRVLDNFQRLNCLFPGFETSIFSGLEADLRAVLERRQGAFDPEQLFYLAAESFAQSLELSARHGLLTADPAQALEDLYARFVAPPAAVPGAARPLTVRRQVIGELRQAFTAAAVLERLDQRMRASALGTGPDPYRFDFHYRPNGVHNLIQAVDLEQDTRGVKELSFTIERLRERLRAQGHGLAVIAVYPQPAAFNLSLAAETTAGASYAEQTTAGRTLTGLGEQSGGLADYHREILAAARIGLHPVSAAAELAAHVRADLKL